MKPINRWWIAAGLILLPVLARTLWFYQFPYWNTDVQTPDYASLTVPEPPTPSADLPATEHSSSGRVVLVDMSHSNQFRADELEPLSTALAARGGRMMIADGLTPISQQLKFASAYIIISPNYAFTTEEQQAIQKFVSSGGRLVVFTDPTRGLTSYDWFGTPSISTDVNFANPILAPYGLAAENGYLYNLQENEGNFRNIKISQFEEHPLTENLGMVVFYGAHSLNNPTGQTLAASSPETRSSLNDAAGQYPALALDSSGNVLALGDVTFLTNPYVTVADNRMLVHNLAGFLLSGSRTASLENFPYLFEKDVRLLTSSTLQLNGDLLTPITSLQNSLKLVNVSLRLADEAGQQDDLILLGTYADGAELAQALRPFRLDLNEFGESVLLPGLGAFNKESSGLLLFNQSADGRSTLILLANSAEDLPELIQLVSYGDLSACLVQGQVGICALSGVGGYGDYYTDPYYYESPTPYFETNPGVDATPTPSG